MARSEASEGPTSERMVVTLKAGRLRELDSPQNFRKELSPDQTFTS